ncbi:dihydroorotate dehydrogenase electron transfer subunit [Candidatus Omnitrophota bacterium]
MPKSESKSLIRDVRIVKNLKIKQDYYKLILKAPQISRLGRPGQFINLRVNNGCQPLLRRPFSIHNITDSSVEILYEVVGQATKILSKRKKGAQVNIIGPLGNGFIYRTPHAARRTPILVAGGMGVAPLLFLAEKLRRGYPRAEITVLIGARSKQEVFCEKEFNLLGCSVKISTDDGTRGFKGRVTGLLRNVLCSKSDPRRPVRPAVIFACGPRMMLEEVSRLSALHRVPAQVSLEEHMACGIGACLGCAVNTKDGFKRACKEGPVFDARQIIWR